MTNIIKKVVQKSRLDEYRALLELALEKKYIITSLLDWHYHHYYPGKKVLILRHDVDSDASGAEKMFLIELSLGVKATYYFRWCSMNATLMKEMHQADFEVALHYETLATYCKEQKIFDPEQITEEINLICRQKLNSELRQFEKQYWKSETICSHGDKRNRLLRTPNHTIIKNIPREELNILFEAYDKEILDRFELYITDSSIKNNFQWKNNLSPIIAIKENVHSICLLTHPRHWNFSFPKNMRHLWLDAKERLA